MSESLQIRDLSLADRPRERLLASGSQALSQGELLAILLRSGIRGASAVALGQQLLSQFGSLEALARAPWQRLCEVRGIGPDKAVTLKAAFELARRFALEARAESPLLDTPAAVAEILRGELSFLETERFVAVLVNTRRRLIRVEEITRGLLDTVLVHAREVFRPAIMGNAHAVILAHNHPGGDPTPSEADIRTTRDLQRSGQLLRIEVLDHVILGRPTTARPKDYCSLRELGYFYS